MVGTSQICEAHPRDDIRISVVIPVLNEAERIGELVRDMLARQPAPEVVVIDGGSDDGTSQVAAGAGARVIHAARGRGQQLRAGANAATGEVLLFLHADTQLGKGALAAIRQTLSEPAITGGNFRILFDGDDSFSRWLEGFYARFRRFGLYYGDSAVFVRRSVYDALGGYRDVALMEDYDFTRRLERHGGTCLISHPPVLSSSRRFQGRHPIFIVLGWIRIHLLHCIGVKPAILARIYDSERRSERTQDQGASFNDQS